MIGSISWINLNLFMISFLTIGCWFLIKSGDDWFPMKYRPLSAVIDSRSAQMLQVKWWLLMMGRFFRVICSIRLFMAICYNNHSLKFGNPNNMKHSLLTISSIPIVSIVNIWYQYRGANHNFPFEKCKEILRIEFKRRDTFLLFTQIFCRFFLSTW